MGRSGTTCTCRPCGKVAAPDDPAGCAIENMHRPALENSSSPRTRRPKRYSVGCSLIESRETGPRPARSAQVGQREATVRPKIGYALGHHQPRQGHASEAAFEICGSASMSLGSDWIPRHLRRLKRYHRLSARTPRHARRGYFFEVRVYQGRAGRAIRRRLLGGRTGA